MSRASSWKYVLVVRPQPGQDETWGRNDRNPSDLQHLLSDCDFFRPIAVRLGGDRDADRVADPLGEQQRQAGGRGHDPLHAHARLGQAEVERVVAARGKSPIHLDQVAYAGNLGRENDPIVGQTGRFCQLGRSDGAFDHGFDHDLMGIARLGLAGVCIHHLGQDVLIERAPVDADPDRLVVRDRDPNDGGEVIVVVPARAHVPRIDPVLGQGFCRLRELGQQLVAVVVEVADDRNGQSEAADFPDDIRHGGSGCLRIDRDSDQLRPGVGQPGNLDGRGVGIGGVRIGHRLNDDWVIAADHDPAHVDSDRTTPRCKTRLGHTYGAPPRTMSK